MRHQHIHHYRNIFLVLLLLATLCLGACNSISTPDRTRIYFVTHITFDLRDYVARFEATHPDIQVHVSYRLQIADDWPEHFDAALMVYGPYENTDLLLDLMPLVEADSQFDVDDYYPGTMAAGYVDGRLVAIPIGLEFDVLVYDPRQLTAAGAALPAPGWTWEDLMNTARTVGHHQANVGTGAVFVDDGDRTGLLLNWLQEQSPFYEENADGTFVPLLDRPEVESAVSNACSARAELTVAIDPQSYSYMDYRPLIYLQDGRAAMVKYSLAWFLRQHSRYPDLAAAAFPQPKLYGDMNAVGVLAISRGTAHQQAVWQWVRFLSRQNLLSRSYTLPARESVAEDLQVWEMLDAETAQVIRAILDGQAGSAVGQNQEPSWIIRDNLMGALFEVCLLGADPGTALAEAQQEATDSIATWYAEQDDSLEPFSIVPPPIADEAEEAAEILTVLGLSPDEDAYLAVAEEFEASHPGWFVRVAPLLGPEIEEADSISFQMNSYDASILLDMQHILLPIESMSELDPRLTNDSFISQAIEAVSWHGQLLGVPTAIRPLVLYYDPDVFAQLGLAAPTSDWTVADVLDAAEEIASANPMWLGYAPRTGAEVRFVLEQQGIRLFADRAYPQPQFTDPDVLRAVERLRALQGGQQVLSWDSTAMELPLVGIPMPVGHGPHMDAVALQPHPGTEWPVDVHVSGVSRQSAHVHVAWEWIIFLAGQEGLHSIGALPAVREAAESEAARQILGADLHAAYWMALERAPALPGRETAVTEDVALWWFERALLEVGAGDLEPVLQQAQAQAERFVDCVAAAGAMDAQALAACARQVDPEHPLAGMAP